MFKLTLSHCLILSGLILGSLASVLLLSRQLPLWLVILFAVLALLIACWQVPQIGMRLSGGKNFPKPKRAASAWRYWLKRLAVFSILALAGIIGEALWWAQQNALPRSSAWKKINWELGIASLPTLIKIPAGQFNMGSEDGASDEKPVHRVKIFNPFQLSQHEITFEQYDYFVWSMRKANLKLKDKTAATVVEYPEDKGWGRATRPVINVSWEQAQQYTHWLSAQLHTQCRLPSEAEWEYAARSGTETEYPWGKEIGTNNANCDSCGSQWDNKQTAPVAQFPANAFRLYDMHGNVWEWVQDCWHDDYTKAPADGSVWKDQCSNSALRVLRGSSWVNGSNFLRSAFRLYDHPGRRNYHLGFRVLCSPPFAH